MCVDLYCCCVHELTMNRYDIQMWTVLGCYTVDNMLE